MQCPEQQAMEIAHSSDLNAVKRVAKAMTAAIGFEERESEEIVLAVSELASNLIRHATRGMLTLTPLADGGHSGIQIESVDKGPGIADVEQSITDGFSTVHSLGYGLGTVNRLMDEFDIASQPGVGTQVVCRRWVRADEPGTMLCPLEFGAATRAKPEMKSVNGDDFVIRQWNQSALVGVIDGLGHGQWAQKAAQAARIYIESHFDQPLTDIFRGVGRMCRATRGVVMTLARFDWAQDKLTFAAVGNIEARVFNSPEPVKFIVRRGIIGLNAPHPVVLERHWNPNNIMVLHSDGVRTHWQWEEFPELAEESATVIAQKLLRALAKDTDDATVLVVRGKQT